MLEADSHLALMGPVITYKTHGRVYCPGNQQACGVVRGWPIGALAATRPSTGVASALAVTSFRLAPLNPELLKWLTREPVIGGEESIACK